MTERENSYNGWRNYQTWATHLWMTNDSGSMEHYSGLAQWCQEAGQEKYPNKFMNKQENVRLLLREALQAELEEQAEAWMPDQASMFADLLNSAIGQIDWYEIADSFLEDLDP